jgi:hypothetical protein
MGFWRMSSPADEIFFFLEGGTGFLPPHGRGRVCHRWLGEGRRRRDLCLCVLIMSQMKELGASVLMALASL